MLHQFASALKLATLDKKIKMEISGHYVFRRDWSHLPSLIKSEKKKTSTKTLENTKLILART